MQTEEKISFPHRNRSTFDDQATSKNYFLMIWAQDPPKSQKRAFRDALTHQYTLLWCYFLTRLKFPYVSFTVSEKEKVLSYFSSSFFRSMI